MDTLATLKEIVDDYKGENIALTAETTFDD